MHRRSLVTVLRTLLLSLFVLGGPGLPLADAVVWHGSGSEQVRGARLDAQDAARLHADACSLAAPLPIPGPVPCNASPVLALLGERAPVAHPQVVRGTVTPDHSARPRAPPAFSA